MYRHLKLAMSVKEYKCGLTASTARVLLIVSLYTASDGVSPR